MAQPQAVPPVPAGLSRITVWSQQRWNTNCGPYPVIKISGAEHRGVWDGPASFLVQPGVHRVEVLPRTFTMISPEALDVSVLPGQDIALHYRCPNAFGFRASLAVVYREPR